MSFKRDILSFILISIVYCIGILIWKYFNFENYVVYFVGTLIGVIAARICIYTEITK